MFSSAAGERGATFCDSKNREAFDCPLDELRCIADFIIEIMFQQQRLFFCCIRKRFMEAIAFCLLTI